MEINELSIQEIIDIKLLVINKLNQIGVVLADKQNQQLPAYKSYLLERYEDYKKILSEIEKWKNCMKRGGSVYVTVEE